MLTIGTAGHIDHGKSSLVKALTNIDPDRLPEEKLRGMTLDLGFAWLTLSSGEKVGIIDVPGHEHFVRNVIPGMSGIDGAILVIAADDGWMPQTEEHMHIINLLGIRRCILALNKIDLVTDSDWLEMVEEDIADKTRGTSLEGSPVVRVSTRNGTGIDEMKLQIERLASDVAASRDIGRPRLPVDRVFTIKGSGVVVTGTLNSGHLSSGDEVVILPGKNRAGVRSAECYKETSSTVGPGCRVALNLTGTKKENISRGDVIVAAGGDQSTSRVVDTLVKLLPHAEFRLKNGEEVLVYIETGEYLARATLLESKDIKGGESGLVQFVLNQECPVYIGQHFIIRRQSPADTIGGGVVLNPFAPKFKTRNAPAAVAWLNRRKNLDPETLIITELGRQGFLGRKGLLSYSQYSAEAIEQAVESLTTRGDLKCNAGYVFMASDWQNQKQAFVDMLQLEHRQNPLKRGLPQSALQLALQFPKEVFGAVLGELIEEGRIMRNGDYLALPEHKPELSADSRQVAAGMLKTFEDNPSAPPSFRELIARYPGSEEVVYFLIEDGALVQLPEGVLMTRQMFENTKQGVVSFLKQNGTLSIQDFNRLFGLSRKYSLPFLNQLDKEKITRWDGETRRLV